MIPTPLVLLFEADVRFCKRPTLPISFFLAEMVEYEYTLLGAPWMDGQAWCRQRGRCSGNSGLSLWSTRAMHRSTAAMQRWTERRMNKSVASNWEIDAFAHQLIVQHGGRLCGPPRRSNP